MTLLQGLRTYRRNCAGCHDKYGAPRVPQFADEGSSLSPAQMFVAVKHGIRGTGM